VSNEIETIDKTEIARSTSTSPKVLKKLSRDKDHEIRAITANNSSTPLEVVEKLSKDEHPYVAMIASNAKVFNY